VTRSSGTPRPFDRPIFIVSTPRSGSTLLFETLEQAPGLFTTGFESHRLIEDIPGLAPRQRGWHSNRLTAGDATAERIGQLEAAFLERLRDRAGEAARPPVRMLEKTPKNALRVPFFDAAFPDALFVYLYRDVRETLGSVIEAWLTGAFRTYPDLPGWTGRPWSLLLVPGWEQLKGQPLPLVVAHQWRITSEILLADLEQLPPERVCVATYADLVGRPQQLIERIAGFAGLGWDRQLGARLPRSKTTVSRPQPGKWRRFEAAIEAVYPIVRDADQQARAFLARFEQSAAAAR
jgi:hypothetical protein